LKTAIDWRSLRPPGAASSSSTSDHSSNPEPPPARDESDGFARGGGHVFSPPRLEEADALAGGSGSSTRQRSSPRDPRRAEARDSGGRLEAGAATRPSASGRRGARPIGECARPNHKGGASSSPAASSELAERRPRPRRRGDRDPRAFHLTRPRSTKSSYAPTGVARGREEGGGFPVEQEKPAPRRAARPSRRQRELWAELQVGQLARARCCRTLAPAGPRSAA